MIEPNILAFQNADLLQAIDDAPLGQWTKRDLARHLERDESNLGKSLNRLTAEGFLQDPPLSGLTDAGRDQLTAFRRAKHGGERRKAKGRWPLEKFRRNPTNRRIDPEAVLGLADAIAGVGDVLVPLVASSPDADGIRTIWAGERRWMAATRLAQMGQLPAPLFEGLPFNEREADRGEAALITLVENGSRTDLTPWEDARQLRLAADATGLNATDLARKIGRAREGDRGGVRDVQVKLKVAREAEPEAIAAYEADPGAPGAWEALRDSVSKPKPKPETEIVLTKPQRLALAELLHKAGGLVGAEVAILPSAHAAEGARLSQYKLAALTRGDTGDAAAVTEAGFAYLQAEGLTGHIEYAREQLGFPAGYGVAAYRTDWLNTPDKAASAAPSADPEVAALAGIEPITATDVQDPALMAQDFGVPAGFSCFDGGKYGNAAYAVAAEWIEPGSLETFSLPHMKGQRDHGFPRAQVQIARIRGSQGWIAADGYSLGDIGNHVGLRGVVHAGTPAFPSRIMALATAVASLREGLGRNLKNGVPKDIATWTDRLLAGEIPATAPDPSPPTEDAADPLVVNGVRHPNLARANEARRAAGILPRPANSGTGARRAPEEQQSLKSVLEDLGHACDTPGDIETAQEEAARADEVADADAARALSAVRAFVREDGVRQPFGGWAFRKHLVALGLSGPFVPTGSGGSDDPDEGGVIWDNADVGFAVCDPNGERHNDIAEAQAELVAYALNLASTSGPNVGPGLHLNWPTEPKEETADQAIVRTGNLLSRILTTHTTTIQGDEALVAEIHRQFAVALRRVERALTDEHREDGAQAASDRVVSDSAPGEPD